MVGRLLKFNLWPFSFREFMFSLDKELFTSLEKRILDIFSHQFKIKDSFGKELNLRIEKLFEKYLIFGGYPAWVLAKKKLKNKKFWKVSLNLIF